MEKQPVQRKPTSEMPKQPVARKTPNAPPPPEERRGFLVRATAVVIGAIVTVFPFAAGLAVFADPLRRSTGKVKPIRVTTLDSVPDDGVPRMFPVIADRRDAWNFYPNEPIGAVYLVRAAGQSQVKAYNATCPHAGCFIDYKASLRSFVCPCHGSTFDVQGERLNEVSPRDMDSLDCRVKDGQILVSFQDFRITTPEKIPKA